MAHEASALPAAVAADLRTDHAGETGAVWIYRGVLAVSRDSQVCGFARRHLETETLHLREIEAWLPPSSQSHLLPLWRVAGWLTGALPALVGPRAVYLTVEAVERFVDQHYGDQVNRLQQFPDLDPLRQVLLACQSDERAHGDEATAARGQHPESWLHRGWSQLVQAGSQAAVAICRHV